MAKTMTTDELKQAIAALSAVKQRRRYPAQLRAEVLRHARARMSAGVSLRAVCEELDVGEPTLTRFLNAEKPVPVLAPAPSPSPKPAPKFARVRVVEKVAAPTTAISVKGPCGLIIEGLATAQLAELVRELACSA